nr:lytic murein transglycosylase [Phaeobacter sp.]
MVRVLFSLLACVFLSSVASADTRSQTEAKFQNWLRTDVWPAARRAGVDRGVFDAAVKNISLNWDLPDLRPPGGGQVPEQQKQAEFRAPAAYFKNSTLASAERVGKTMAGRHRATLSRIERQTGVPGRIILAIWGRESAYGSAAIPHDAFEVLATKAFMGRRAEFFREELIAALQIVDGGHAPAGRLKSSWAGALGQPQFMPRNFLAYAQDGDGDGRRDIWRSETDTLASIGRYLAAFDWQRGRDWGFEVKVPTDVSCALEGPDQGRRVQDWQKLGISRVSGRPFPAHERQGEAYLLMPAGRHGPAFLVTPNFYVLKKYNKSDLYALFVGHMGDRIDFGVGAFSARWQSVDTLSRSGIAAMQSGLERLGYDVGGADGLVGYKTRRSIGEWQLANGQAATCFPDRKIVSALAR